jgi:fluoride exporter
VAGDHRPGAAGFERVIVVVFIAGVAGAALRYVVDGLVQQRWGRSFPLGTFVVNVSGALALGLITGLVLEHPAAPSLLRIGAGIGLVGSYTTFSTLMFESFRALREGAWRIAAVNTLGSTACGMALAAVGLRLGRI